MLPLIHYELNELNELNEVNEVTAVSLHSLAPCFHDMLL